MKNDKLKQYAKKMLYNPTPYELAFSRKLIDLDIKFKQQAVISPYIVDFLINNIVIESDGGNHFTEKGIEYDKKRTNYLNKLGYCVVRIANSNVNKTDIKKIILEKNIPNFVAFKKSQAKSKKQKIKDRIDRMLSKLSEKDRKLQSRYDKHSV